MGAGVKHRSITKPSTTLDNVAQSSRGRSNKLSKTIHLKIVQQEDKQEITHQLSSLIGQELP